MHGFSSRTTPTPQQSGDAQRAPVDAAGVAPGSAMGWIYRLAQGGGSAAARPTPPTGAPVDGDACAGTGRPLDAATRQYFEPRVGFGLGGVRIHDGPAAHRAAEALQARAFTVGEHIGFRAGEYSATSTEGRRVLAHELAHVGQAYEGRTGGASRVSQPGEPLEVEAERAAAHAAGPAWRTLAPRPAPALDGGALVLRMEITMSSQNRVTDTAPAATDNIKEEVLSLLDRMHTLWGITNDAYDNQAVYIRLLAAGAQVPQRDPAPPAAALAAGITAPWSFQPTIDAIARTREPTLAAPVIRRYMAVAVTGPVGRGLANVREDVLTVMTRLNFLSAYATFASEQTAVTALAAGSRVSDGVLTGTYAAIRAFKEGLAAGTAGIDPMHANEREFGGADRLAGQTSVVDGNTIPVVQPGATSPTPFTKHFSVFVPRGVVAGRNKVHLFFTPFEEPAEFVAQQGLREQHDGTEWILIGVPGLLEQARPSYVTISTAEIQGCLAAAGRGTAIDAIRMSAHSRGHRGLSHTLGGGGGGAPQIPLGLVESVTVFDASYSSLGAAIRSHAGALTRMQDPAHPGRLAPGTVRLYDVTVGNVSGLAGTSLDQALIRGLSYIRLLEEGLARGEVSRADLATLPAATQAATTRLLAAIPPRGRFSTRSPTPPGQTALAGFMTANRADLTVVDHATNGLKPFITSFGSDRGASYSRSIDAHHWFVTELAHEAIE